MKKLKVSIFVRIREEGKQRYVPPVWLTKTVLKPGWAFVAPGKPEHRPEGSYALRYLWKGKQRWESVGQDAPQAILKRTEREWQINHMDELPERRKPEFAKKGGGRGSWQARNGCRSCEVPRERPSDQGPQDFQRL